jgi:hypothetical protein
MIRKLLVPTCIAVISAGSTLSQDLVVAVTKLTIHLNPMGSNSNAVETGLFSTDLENRQASIRKMLEIFEQSKSA